MTTQLNIKIGKFFICGPINGDLLDTYDKFAIAEKVLNSYGCNTLNQFMIYNTNGLTIDNFKYTVMHLIGCKTVVTLQHWAGCDFAIRQVEIARIMGMDVIEYSSIVLKLAESKACLQL